MSEFSTLDALSAAMEAAYTANHPRRALHDEEVRRKAAPQSIDDILLPPVAATLGISADALEFLELLVSYWRELEVPSTPLDRMQSSD